MKYLPDIVSEHKRRQKSQGEGNFKVECEKVKMTSQCKVCMPWKCDAVIRIVSKQGPLLGQDFQNIILMLKVKMTPVCRLFVGLMHFNNMKQYSFRAMSQRRFSW